MLADPALDSLGWGRLTGESGVKAPVCSFIPLLQAPPGGRAPGMGEGKVAEGMEGRGGWKTRREGGMQQEVLGCPEAEGTNPCTAQDPLPLVEPSYPISS